MGACASNSRPNENYYPNNAYQNRPLHHHHRPTSKPYQRNSLTKRYSQQHPAPNNPILVDSNTHALRLMTSSQLEIIPLQAVTGFNRSPTRRSTVVPNGTHESLRRPTSIRVMKPVDIDYSELTFKQLLGQGTYGEVSRGYWRGKKVAIKKIFPGDNPEERMEVVADFDKEMSILSKLKHPRIVQYIGAVNKVGQPFCLVFELCEGSVAVLLKMVRRGFIQISWRVCLGILKDCAEAVHYLHSQNPKVIHRDLKAENLLLESNFHCKLTDFGLSRNFDSRKPSAMTVCGTPCWVAPEVFRNEPYDEKIDVYSYGVLIWEVCAAKKPYGDRDCNDLSRLVGRKGLRPGRLPHVPIYR